MGKVQTFTFGELFEVSDANFHGVLQHTPLINAVAPGTAAFTNSHVSLLLRIFYPKLRGVCVVLIGSPASDPAAAGRRKDRYAVGQNRGRSIRYEQ